MNVPLLEAARQGNIMIVRDLIYYRADYNSTDKDDKNCLHIAAEKGFIDVVSAQSRYGQFDLKNNITVKVIY